MAESEVVIHLGGGLGKGYALWQKACLSILYPPVCAYILHVGGILPENALTAIVCD